MEDITATEGHYQYFDYTGILNGLKKAQRWDRRGNPAEDCSSNAGKLLALDSGASLEDVQSAAGHADPSTTKLYDRPGDHVTAPRDTASPQNHWGYCRHTAS